jgi:aldehyde:ferredoxin oxidoreductase
MPNASNRVILRVDLTKGEIVREEMNKEWAKLFIGGRGYGDKIIYQEVNPTIDPLAEDNKVVVTVGPLAGTRAPAGSRVMVITKGSLTNTIACSNAGGFFGNELARAGYQIIIIQGKSRKPVYLWIDDDNVEIRSAENIWNKTVPDATSLIKGETEAKARTMVIGPAGEKLSRIASVMVDVFRASGRTGVGAVLGSKHLKGIAVRGKQPVKAMDEDGFKIAVQNALNILKKEPTTSEVLPKYGTASLVNIINEFGCLPVHNYSDAYFINAKKISGETLAEQILIKKKACFGCPIACGRMTQIKEGRYKGEQGEGPEFETIWSLGAMCDIDDLNTITKAHYLCNEYGLDAISTGVTISCAMELYERGFLPKTDSPFPIRFGDGEAVINLIKLMAHREGLGNLLAEGSYRLAEYYGHPEFSMTVKKQELPAYDARGIKGMGLGYATSNRGACHLRGYTLTPELFDTMDESYRLKYEGKAELVKYWQDYIAAIDASGACFFTSFALKASNYAELIKTATGISYEENTFLLAGERIWNLERLFNLGVGFNKNDDTLPERLLQESVKTGPSSGEVVQLDRMLPDYYRARGWDIEGRPTKAKIIELNL